MAAHALQQMALLLIGALFLVPALGGLDPVIDEALAAIPSMLVRDDECSGDSRSDCALNALQRKGLQKAAALQSTSATGEEASEQPLEGGSIWHYAQDCWYACREQEGFCEDFCGPGNACCRNGMTETAECKATMWWPIFGRHTCVKTSAVPTTTAMPTTTEEPEPVTVTVPDAVIDHPEQCETVHRFGGSDCSTAVNWARKDGIYANPDWFPELQAGASSWEEFQMHIHSASPDQCPKPCTLTYDSYSAPTFRSAGMPVMKGIAYGPAPLKSDKKVLLNDDFTDEIAGAMWAPWGRNDLQVIKDMGANTIRLYGNDPNVSKRDFLDEAMKDGFSVISGMSDYGFIQGPTPCEKDNWYCFDQVYESYMVNLKHGLTINNFTSYHPALKALIISNEPDLKVKPRSLTCRAMVSSWDAILQAEKDLGVTGNPIAFTVTFTFASWGAGAPGLSQMQDFYHCLKNPGAAPTLYTPKNDVLKAYNERFVNSFNTNNPAADVKRLLIDKYARSFWNSALKIPLFIGEYHSTYKAVRQDLKDMMAVASDQRYPFFMGLNFFEFSVRYDKGGSEMNFGAFGYGNCLLSNMNFSGDVYSIWNLVPTKDKVGDSMDAAIADVYGAGAVPLRLKSSNCMDASLGAS